MNTKSIVAKPTTAEMAAAKPTWASQSCHWTEPDGTFTIEHYREIPATDTNAWAWLSREDAFNPVTRQSTAGAAVHAKWEPGTLTSELAQQAAATVKIIEDLIKPETLTAAKK